MSEPLRLILFDVDGTLVDSQGDIVASMAAAFQAEGLEPPTGRAILTMVGLALEIAIPRLAPGRDVPSYDRMITAYKQAYFTLRQTSGAASSPLYPGVQATLETLWAVPHYLLGIATGKSRRGLTGLLENHGMTGRFVTEQVGDFHPSKPHPAMALAALSETGVAPENAVMIGDTTYDMEMARAAGLHTIGVSWGYHAPEELGADTILATMHDLPAALQTIWSTEK